MPASKLNRSCPNRSHLRATPYRRSHQGGTAGAWQHEDEIALVSGEHDIEQGFKHTLPPEWYIRFRMTLPLSAQAPPPSRLVLCFEAAVSDFLSLEQSSALCDTMCSVRACFMAGASADKLTGILLIATRVLAGSTQSKRFSSQSAASRSGVCVHPPSSPWRYRRLCFVDTSVSASFTCTEAINTRCGSAY